MHDFPAREWVQRVQIATNGERWLDQGGRGKLARFQYEWERGQKKHQRRVERDLALALFDYDPIKSSVI